MSKKTRKAPSPNSAADSLNVQYNEMISEVSTLIRESVEKAQIDREIEMARSVQSTLMPPRSAEYDDISVAGRCYVAGSCGGDWWYHTRNEDKIVVWLGDVIGHGIASALVASACRAVASSSNIGGFERSVSDSMSLMNEVVYEMTNGELYATVFYAKIDLKTGQTEICNGGHPPAIRLFAQASSKPAFLNEPINPPVGQQRGLNYESLEFTLDPQACLFLMSDGLLDMPPPPSIRWNVKGLVRYLEKSVRKNPSATSLISAVEALFGDEISSTPLPDDVTFIGVCRR